MRRKHFSQPIDEHSFPLRLINPWLIAGTFGRFCIEWRGWISPINRGIEMLLWTHQSISKSLNSLLLFSLVDFWYFGASTNQSPETPYPRVGCSSIVLVWITNRGNLHLEAWRFDLALKRVFKGELGVPGFVQLRRKPEFVIPRARCCSWRINHNLINSKGGESPSLELRYSFVLYFYLNACFKRGWFWVCLEDSALNFWNLSFLG